MKSQEYYESLDKRTKEYKEWKANFEKENSKGAGDIVEDITKATGIKKVVELFTPEGKDCGCDQRKDKLNNLPVRIKLFDCPTQEQFEFMQDFFDRNPNRIQHHEQQKIVEILNQSLGKRYKANRCGTCFKGWVNELRTLYSTYLN